jgi:DNA-binding NarL/FixJ family response regulator
MRVGVLVADDHPILRQGLKTFLEKEGFHVVAETADGYEAVRLTEQLHPDVVLLDISMPRLNGLDAAREILRTSPRTKVALLTVHREEQYLLEALRAGVKAYVLKAEAVNSLVQAIQEICRGNIYLSPHVCRGVVNACLAKSGTPVEVLSPRELQVLQLIVEGNTTKEIAARLNLTVKTAESYRTSLMDKLDIHDTATLVRYAVRRGMVKL